MTQEKKKIFVADDNEDILSVIKDFLTSKDFDVLTSNDSTGIIGSIKSFNPDLILLDLLMPGMGGFEICEILNKDAETQGIPIIVVSGLQDITDIKRAYAIGVVGYLTKPFNLKILLEEINKAIANKQSQS